MLPAPFILAGEMTLLAFHNDTTPKLGICGQESLDAIDGKISDEHVEFEFPQR